MNKPSPITKEYVEYLNTLSLEELQKLGVYHFPKEDKDTISKFHRQIIREDMEKSGIVFNGVHTSVEEYEKQRLEKEIK